MLCEPSRSAGIGAMERCGTMRFELAALFEREFAPVAQWIRAADFGASPPVRCASERGWGSVSDRVICSVSAHSDGPGPPVLQATVRVRARLSPPLAVLSPVS